MTSKDISQKTLPKRDFFLPCIAGSTPTRDVIIPAASEPAETPPAQTDEAAPKKKAKRTGKPRPVHESINFQVYLERWLSEKHVTYKTWVAEHRRNQVWVCLGSIDCELFVFFYAGTCLTHGLHWDIWIHLPMEC